MKNTISDKELEERVAIVRRFKSLLEQQRQKFKEYLNVLELQEGKIEEEDVYAIRSHEELGNQIVKNISELQRAIVPMQQLYTSTRAASYNPKEAVPIEQIQSELEQLQRKVLTQNERNRELLNVHLADVRRRLSSLQNPYKSLQSIYAEKSPSTLINIEA